MDFPYGSPAAPYYASGAGYGGKQDWRTTPFVKNYLDPQIPEGVFAGHLGERGYGGTDALSTWAQGQYGRTLAGYKAAMRENPALMYKDYLRKTFNQPTIQNLWLGQTARARGENPTAFTGGTRLISWG